MTESTKSIYKCSECGYLTSEITDCPFCGIRVDFFEKVDELGRVIETTE